MPHSHRQGKLQDTMKGQQISDNMTENKITCKYDHNECCHFCQLKQVIAGK